MYRLDGQFYASSTTLQTTQLKYINFWVFVINGSCFIGILESHESANNPNLAISVGIHASKWTTNMAWKIFEVGFDYANGFYFKNSMKQSNSIKNTTVFHWALSLRFALASVLVP